MTRSRSSSPTLLPSGRRGGRGGGRGGLGEEGGSQEQGGGKGQDERAGCVHG